MYVQVLQGIVYNTYQGLEEKNYDLTLKQLFNKSVNILVVTAVIYIFSPAQISPALWPLSACYCKPCIPLNIGVPKNLKC
jgi:hypothetical protein